MHNYEYPIDFSWDHQEMKDVISLWNAVELAYEKGVNKEEFLKSYRNFKRMIPSKGEEKRYGDLFEKRSGYSLYQVVKMSKITEKQIISMSSNETRGKKAKR